MFLWQGYEPDGRLTCLKDNRGVTSWGLHKGGSASAAITETLAKTGAGATVTGDAWHGWSYAGRPDLLATGGKWRAQRSMVPWPALCPSLAGNDAYGGRAAAARGQ